MTERDGERERLRDIRKKIETDRHTDKPKVREKKSTYKLRTNTQTDRQSKKTGQLGRHKETDMEDKQTEKYEYLRKEQEKERKVKRTDR